MSTCSPNSPYQNISFKLLVNKTSESQTAIIFRERVSQEFLKVWNIYQFFLAFHHRQNTWSHLEKQTHPGRYQSLGGSSQTATLMGLSPQPSFLSRISFKKHKRAKISWALRWQQQSNHKSLCCSAEWNISLNFVQKKKTRLYQY